MQYDNTNSFWKKLIKAYYKQGEEQGGWQNSQKFLSA